MEAQINEKNIRSDLLSHYRGNTGFKQGGMQIVGLAFFILLYLIL